MNQAICEAIRNRAVLEFYYDGQNRIVEPHAHGLSTAGNNVLRCYQIEGGSISGKVPGWKLMDVSKIKSLKKTERRFSRPRPDYKKNDRGMTKIYCEL